MSAFTSKEEFDAAVEATVAAASAYYNTDALEMTDSEYDALIERIELSVSEFPEWATEAVTGLLESVAAGVSGGVGDVTHPSPMLSLGKVTTTSDFDAFLSRIGNVELVTEVKLDGMAVRATYVDGILIQAVTRGDGVSGEDVTSQALQISGLPARLSSPVSFDVRGEVYMTDEDFEIASANRVKSGKSAFVNPRNATAGSLRNTDQKYVAPMSFAAYDVFGEPFDAVDSYRDRMGLLQGFGVTSALSLISEVPEGAHDAIARIEELRGGLGFPIDGAVVKVDSFIVRENLGTVSRSPRWAVAWKYAAAEARSVLRAIEVTVGRTGRMALTGLIDPVFVGGATVSRATLHNPAFVEEQGLGIGSPVVVVRAGDVVPRVTGVLGDAVQAVDAWVAPEVCPQCGEAWNKSSLLWRCETPSCSVVSWIEYFCSRDALDIERVGSSVCEALVESGKASSPADLYVLSEDEWAQLPLGYTAKGGVRRLGAANAKAIMQELEDSKKQPYNRVLTGLGIRLTGRTVSRWLAREFPSIEVLLAATVEEISAVEGLGAIKAKAIVDGLIERKPVIDRLQGFGLQMRNEVASTENLPLAGKTVVVTGSMTGPLSSLSRNEMNELIERCGGKASGSVSARTSLLVCGEAGSSKYVKATELGVQIVSPEEFATLISFAGPSS